MQNLQRSDIKSGMVLKLQKKSGIGSFYGLVISTEIFLFDTYDNKKWSGSLSTHHIQLAEMKLNTYTILSITEPVMPKDTNIGTDLDTWLQDDCLGKFQKTIWERPQETVMSIKEIEKALGVKNLKITK